MALRDLSPSQHTRLLELLDESLELSTEARAVWLADLERSNPEFGPILRNLFTAQRVNQAEGFLATGNSFARHLRSAAVPDDSTLIGQQIGPYRVLSLLGHGGMGSVWLAERVDGLFARKVALKLLQPALMSRTLTERFTREREILASLNHPNIAQLFDAGFAADGQPYLALEYVAGAPLTTYCDQRRLSIAERLQLLRQVLAAVQYAHANLIIHRDLKPSNILVTEEGQARLLDFGIAKPLTGGEAKETELTQLGGQALTPEYAAPEQIAGAVITTAADVYALGVMLYELLTGERPYRLSRDSRGALEEAILQAEPVAPSRLALRVAAAQARATTVNKLQKMLRGDLDTIVLKSLRKSPGERYPTVNALSEDIGRFLRAEVVLARRDSLAYQAFKFARRHRVGIAVAAALLLTLIGGLTATSYEARVAARERDTALQAQLRSLTQTAAASLKDGDTTASSAIILEVLRHRGANYTSQALSVFHEARAADTQVYAITGHSGRIRAAAFSPDGRRIVTASYDKTAAIWDAATGRRLVQLSGHTERVAFACFSPDGSRIATASFDQTARIWDAATGRQIMVLRGHTGRVISTDFSPDGRRVVTASFDKTARVWDTATGQQVLLLSGHTDIVPTAEFSPDGRRIVTASYDNTAGIWDATTGREMTVLTGHRDYVSAAAFSPDGQRVATASGDKTARIWDVATGRELTRLTGHAGQLETAAFSPDGTQVVTSSDDDTARIWNTTTGQELMVLSGHTARVSAATFSPDGERIITASVDETARMWEPTAQQTLLKHADRVISAAFSPDGRRLVTASTDKTAHIWDTATAREIMVLSGHDDRVVWAAFSPDGQRVVTASLDRTARIWDSTTGRETTRLSGHLDLLETATFSPDGKRVATSSDDGTARIWDAATGGQLLLLKAHTKKVTSAMFSRDGSTVVTSSTDGTARLWNSATGRELLLLSGHAGGVLSATFSGDGRRVITTSDDKTARIWDTASGRPMTTLSGHKGWVVSAAFSPDGQRVVTASFDKTARVWDSATGQELAVLGGHTDGVETAAFSPDGRWVVTASDDHTVRIRDASVPPLEVQIGWAEAAQFEPLPGTQRFELGLPASTGVRQFPSRKSKCDESAAAPYDPDRHATGVTLDQIVPDIATAACARSGDDPRSLYQHGRALLAAGDLTGAKRDFSAAVHRGYRAARVDLAGLLANPSGGMLDLPLAVSLYEHAWADGVTNAAFQLGRLYEHGLGQHGEADEHVLAPDVTAAWSWYQKAKQAGDPSALASFGERAEDAAAAAEGPAKQQSYLLEAFEYYAAAAERARIEDWPDQAWRKWRYRRASLARLLARQGMMQQVADTYRNVCTRYAAPSPTLWTRLAAIYDSR